MNLFDFLYSIINFASQSFGNFIATFLLMGMSMIGFVVMIGSLSGFRLFSINNSTKEKSDKVTKITPSRQQGPEHQNTIYDLLVDAYDRYKEKKNNKGSDDKKGDI